MSILATNYILVPLITNSNNYRVYESIGRMFALTTVPEMTATLKTRKETAEEIIKECDTHKAYLIKTLKGQEDNLRELVQQKRDAK